MIKSKYNYHLLLILTTTIWGGGFLAGKIVTQTMDPVVVSFLRYAIASLILFPMMWLTEPKRTKVSKENLLMLCLLALTGVVLYNIGFFIASKYTTVVKSSLVISSNGPMIAILSGIFLKEKININNIIAMLCSVIGGITIITNGNFSIISNGFSWIDIVLILTSLSWAVFAVLSKHAMKIFSPLVLTTYISGLGTIMMFPLASMYVSKEQFINASVEEWFSLLFIAVFVSVISHIWWNKGIHEVGAAKASVFISIMPLSAAIMATIFLKESLTLPHIIGGILVIGGVYINSINSKLIPIGKEVKPNI